MKKVFLTVLAALAAVIPVHAQSSPLRFEAGLNPVSYLHQSGKNLWGGSFSLAMHRSNRLSYVADFAVHQTRDSNPFTTSAYRFGLRYYATHKGKFTPFGEVLAGGANTGAVTTQVGTKISTIPGHNGVAFAAGGGVDRAFKSWFSWRVLHVDYSFIHAGSNLSGVRIQTGGVFHFGRSE